MEVRTQRTLQGGLVAGLIGYGTVVGFFAVLNLIEGRSPFHTAALLGSALFMGLDDPVAVEVAARPVLAYNAVHLLAFLAAGFVTSWLVSLAERHPSVQYLVLVLLLVIGFHVYGAVLLAALPLFGSGAWWRTGVPSFAAAALMGWYLLRVHPLLRRQLHEIPMGDTQ
jgi:sugar phosphate permease